MPIYELSYRDWQGTRTPQSRRWLTIFMADFAILARKRWLRFFVALGLSPSLVVLFSVLWNSGLLINIIASFSESTALGLAGSSAVPAVDAKLFCSFYHYQNLILFLLALLAGSGRVANDIRTNAFLIYLSRPVTELDYVFGKFAAVAAVLATVSLIPGMGLLALSWLLRPNPGALFKYAHPFVIDARVSAAVVLVGVVACLYYAAGVLLCSAFSESARGAAVRFAALYYLSGFVYGMASMATGSTRVMFLSFQGNLDAVSSWFFGVEPPSDLNPAIAFIVVAGLIAVAVLTLKRRVRAVEVVE